MAAHNPRQHEHDGTRFAGRARAFGGAACSEFLIVDGERLKTGVVAVLAQQTGVHLAHRLGIAEVAEVINARAAFE